MSISPRPNRSIDYSPCRYGSSKIRFRGPARPVRGDYLAFIGSTETYGRFVEKPFPNLIEDRTGMAAINLGCQNAGIDAFVSSPDLLNICSMARVTVVQVMGAPNMSNRFYTVDPRQNNRFIRSSKRFKEVYPEVDFTEFELTEHLLTGLARIGPDRLPMVRQELQSAWVARMRTLLSQIDGYKILLWLSEHAPYSAATGGTICRDPLFVDRAMLNALSNYADDLVEVVATPEDVTLGRGHLVYSEFEKIDAIEALGPFVHERVADALAAHMEPMLSTTPFHHHPNAQETLIA